MFPSHSSDSQMRSCCSFFHEVPTSELRSFFMNIVPNVGTSLISQGVKGPQWRQGLLSANERALRDPSGGKDHSTPMNGISKQQ